uniref:Very-long-chain (3R)-3-hydroxyacyl-CoA dehydratase n=1 Tax=Blastobotrys adeninivorans TaxID=409370 RepID=A0A060T2I4_BLAAD
MSVKQYLVAYNSLSAFLWLCVLGRLIILFPLVGSKFVAGGLADFTKYVQTLAVLEVVHSVLGLVKSPIVTTVIQISSRLLLVWGVVDLFPEVAQNVAFSTMVLAWSVTEVVRYSYYAYNLLRDKLVPKGLVWLRYNAFYVLYPLGAGSEAILAFLSLDRAQELSAYYALFLKVVLLIYPPGFYVMYTHMIKQRRRVFKNIGKRPDVKKTQ